MFTGEQISADDALSIGLVNQVVDYDQFYGAVEDFANKLVALSPLSLRLLKGAIKFGMQMDLESATRMESYLFANCFVSEDRIEGVRAFLEKRKPKFKRFWLSFLLRPSYLQHKRVGRAKVKENKK